MAVCGKVGRVVRTSWSLFMRGYCVACADCEFDSELDVLAGPPLHTGQSAQEQTCLPACHDDLAALKMAQAKDSSMSDDAGC
jgi:hypothetical protein